MSREGGSDVAVDRRKQFEQRAPAYLNMLFAIVFSITHDRELSTEITQQALVNYLSRREAENWQQDIKNEGAYLVQIARHLLTDGWRSQGKAELVSLDQQLDDRLLSQLAETFDIEKQMYFEELLRTLPWKILLGKFSEYQNHLLQLHVVEEMSYEEIAEEVNENVIVVKYKLDAIYSTIRARIKRICGKKGLFK
jgi:RNA polymerase sigma factor (sigma-70 family)